MDAQVLPDDASAPQPGERVASLGERAASPDERRASAEWKCFEYVCMRFPNCLHAVGDCCGADGFFEGRTLTARDCLDLPEKPYFVQRDRRAQRWQHR